MEQDLVRKYLESSILIDSYDFVSVRDIFRDRSRRTQFDSWWTIRKSERIEVWLVIPAYPRDRNTVFSIEPFGEDPSGERSKTSTRLRRFYQLKSYQNAGVWAHNLSCLVQSRSRVVISTDLGKFVEVGTPAWVVVGGTKERICLTKVEVLILWVHYILRVFLSKISSWDSWSWSCLVWGFDRAPLWIHIEINVSDICVMANIRHSPSELSGVDLPTANRQAIGPVQVSSQGFREKVSLVETWGDIFDDDATVVLDSEMRTEPMVLHG